MFVNTSHSPYFVRKSHSYLISQRDILSHSNNPLYNKESYYFSTNFSFLCILCARWVCVLLIFTGVEVYAIVRAYETVSR